MQGLEARAQLPPEGRDVSGGGDLLEDRMVEALIAAIQELGEEIFEVSQDLVPVGATGSLKRSGRLTRLRDGFQITYTAPHAGDGQYLTDAVDEVMAYYPGIMAQRMDKELAT